MGVLSERYADNRYEATQRIGAAVRHLGFDALIVPSARWDCANLVLFPDNHAFENELTVLSTESFDWMQWAIAHGFLDASDPAVQAALKAMSEHDR